MISTTMTYPYPKTVIELDLKKGFTKISLLKIFIYVVTLASD